MLVQAENVQKKYKDFNGKIQEAIPELTLTQTDFELLKENYDLEDLEYISGCYFKAEIGLFDEYINKYQAIKENSSGANRQIAKLYLNNLAGKFAQSRNSSYKVPFKSEKFDNFYEQYQTPLEVLLRPYAFQQGQS